MKRLQVLKTDWCKSVIGALVVLLAAVITDLEIGDTVTIETGYTEGGEDWVIGNA